LIIFSFHRGISLPLICSPKSSSTSAFSLPFLDVFAASQAGPDSRLKALRRSDLSGLINHMTAFFWVICHPYAVRSWTRSSYSFVIRSVAMIKPTPSEVLHLGIKKRKLQRACDICRGGKVSHSSTLWGSVKVKSHFFHRPGPCVLGDTLNQLSFGYISLVGSGIFSETLREQESSPNLMQVRWRITKRGSTNQMNRWNPLRMKRRRRHRMAVASSLVPSGFLYLSPQPTGEPLRVWTIKMSLYPPQLLLTPKRSRKTRAFCPWQVQYQRPMASKLVVPLRLALSRGYLMVMPCKLQPKIWADHPYVKLPKISISEGLRTGGIPPALGKLLPPSMFIQPLD